MKSFVLIVLLTALAIAAGFFVGYWIRGLKSEQQCKDAVTFYRLYNARGIELALRRIRSGSVSDGIEEAELTMALDLAESRQDIPTIADERRKSGHQREYDKIAPYTKEYPSDAWSNPWLSGALFYQKHSGSVPAGQSK